MGSAVSRRRDRFLYGDPMRYLTEDERWSYMAQNATRIEPSGKQLRTFEPDDSVEGQGWRALTVLSSGLLLDIKVINQLYSLFCMADLDDTHTLDIWEFLLFFRIDDSKFNQKLFALFDMDGSQEIDLLEFCCAVWNLCTWSPEELGKLMFYLYDDDQSGYLDLAECSQMVEEVFERRTVKTGAQLLIDSLHLVAEPGSFRDEMRVTEDAFIAWAQDRHEVTHPLRCLFSLVRNKVLGAEYWDLIGARARKTVLLSLADIVKVRLGAPGAAEAVEESMEYAEEVRQRELQKEQNEAIWGEKSGANGPEGSGFLDDGGGSVVDADGAFDVRRATARVVKQRKRLVRAAGEKVRAMRFLHEARLKRAEEWDARLAEIKARGDPLSVLLRFSDRELLPSLKVSFDDAWAAATGDLLGKLQLKEKEKRRVGPRLTAADVYFQTKHIRDLPVEMRPDPKDVHFSSASGKLTWVEQDLGNRRRSKREQRRAKASGFQAYLAEEGGNDGDDTSDAYGDLSDSDEQGPPTALHGQGQERIEQPGEPYFEDPPMTNTERCNLPKRQYALQHHKRPSKEWRQGALDKERQRRLQVNVKASGPTSNY